VIESTELEELSNAGLEAELPTAIRKLTPDQVKTVGEAIEKMLEEESAG